MFEHDPVKLFLEDFAKKPNSIRYFIECIAILEGKPNTIRFYLGLKSHYGNIWRKKNENTAAGFEPGTPRLTAKCSTNWAIMPWCKDGAMSHLKFNVYYIIVLHFLGLRIFGSGLLSKNRLHFGIFTALGITMLGLSLMYFQGTFSKKVRFRNR